jgi:hypothetical protein
MPPSNEVAVRLNDRIRDHEHYETVRQEFPVGRHVRKASGYDWPGEVCGYGVSRSGRLTINVENRLSPGTIHVFPPSQLVREDRTVEQILEAVRERLLEKEDL